ncbi:MAG: RNA-binding S4 domain-containing protein [Pigmentiphaga sp.]|nr:RNA-binding S4 domain-containing protein [Pigmentiphaga sp.]
MQTITFPLTGEYIALCDLLKLVGIASSGGAAKVLIAEGQVRVDGQVELRKTCKIRQGQRVEAEDTEILIS